MRRRPNRLVVREESTSMLRAARAVFAPHADIFSDIIAEIDRELLVRELPVLASELGAFLVAAPAEVA